VLQCSPIPPRHRCRCSALAPQHAADGQRTSTPARADGRRIPVAHDHRGRCSGYWPAGPPPSTSAQTSPTPWSATSSHRDERFEREVVSRCWPRPPGCALIGHHDTQGQFRIDGSPVRRVLRGGRQQPLYEPHGPAQSRLGGRRRRAISRPSSSAWHRRRGDGCVAGRGDYDVHPLRRCARRPPPRSLHQS